MHGHPGPIKKVTQTLTPSHFSVRNAVVKEIPRLNAERRNKNWLSVAISSLIGYMVTTTATHYHLIFFFFSVWTTLISGGRT